MLVDYVVLESQTVLAIAALYCVHFWTAIIAWYFVMIILTDSASLLIVKHAQHSESYDRKELVYYNFLWMNVKIKKLLLQSFVQKENFYILLHWLKKDSCIAL